MRVDLDHLRFVVRQRLEPYLEWLRQPDQQRALAIVAAGIFLVSLVLLGMWAVGSWRGGGPPGYSGGVTDYARQLRPFLAADPRWRDVAVAADRDETGRRILLIGGTVRDSADLEALRALVATTTPPVEIRWQVDLPAPPDEPEGSTGAHTAPGQPRQPASGPLGPGG